MNITSDELRKLGVTHGAREKDKPKGLQTKAQLLANSVGQLRVCFLEPITSRMEECRSDFGEWIVRLGQLRGTESS
jgi:hypothetical protein